jgi:hypothetical protein
MHKFRRRGKGSVFGHSFEYAKVPALSDNMDKYANIASLLY